MLPPARGMEYEPHDLSLVDRITDHNPAEQAGETCPGILAGKLNQLIGADIAIYWHGAFPHHFIHRILLQPR